MKRLTHRTEPFFCSPKTGCPSSDCEGTPPGSPSNHGVGSDEWYFTVVHGTQATTLMVFGTDLHEGIPADHPARSPSAPIRTPRGATVSTCRSTNKREAREDCPYLGTPCENDGASYLLAAALWQNTGVDAGKLEQPDSFWEALELLARSHCEERCCEELTDEEEARLTPLLKRHEPKLTEAELAELADTVADHPTN
jgi:hypothetical protein